MKQEKLELVSNKKLREVIKKALKSDDWNLVRKVSKELNARINHDKIISSKNRREIYLDKIKNRQQKALL